jgi:predicted secreted protein
MDKTNIDFELEINEIFTIEFQSNSSTGYSWMWVNMQSNSIVEKMETVFVNEHPEMSGRSSTEVWGFKGLAVGIVELKFEYKRAWLECSTIETKEIYVRVL